MLDLIVNSAVTHSLLFLLPMLCAFILRAARCPGAAVLGGVVAGVMLGPTMLGRLQPAAFEKSFIGGVETRAALQDLLHRQQGERLVADAARADPKTLAELDATHAVEREAAELVWAEAKWAFQRPFRSFTAAVITLTLLGSGLRRARPARDPARRGGGLVAASSIGLWASALPGALAYAAMTWLWRHPAPEALLTAAAVAIGPWVLTTVDREAADHAEVGGARTLEAAGRIASCVALIAIAVAIARALGPIGLVWAAPFLALPCGWLLPPPRERRWLELVLEGAFVPCVAACVAIRIELLTQLALWPLVVLTLLSGDGRWLGAFVGAMLPGGRRALRTMRLVLGAMACGPTQLAVTAMAVHLWALPEGIPLALLAGAIIIETITPARRRMAERLAAAERELSGE